MGMTGAGGYSIVSLSKAWAWTAPPRQGTVWRFAVAVHDQDDLNTPIGDTLWPQTW